MELRKRRKNMETKRMQRKKMDRGRRNHFIKRLNGAIKKTSAIHFHCIAAHKLQLS
jgi:hypothetical protein